MSDSELRDEGLDGSEENKGELLQGSDVRNAVGLRDHLLDATEEFSFVEYDGATHLLSWITGIDWDVEEDEITIWFKTPKGKEKIYTDENSIPYSWSSENKLVQIAEERNRTMEDIDNLVGDPIYIWKKENDDENDWNWGYTVELKDEHTPKNNTGVADNNRTGRDNSNASHFG